MRSYLPQLEIPEHIHQLPYPIQNDDLLTVLRSIFETLEVIDVHVIRVWREDDEEKIMQLMYEPQEEEDPDNPKKTKLKPYKKRLIYTIPVEPSRLCTLHIEFGYGNQIFHKYFFCPRQLDDLTYLINGISNYLIYQMVESEGYSVNSKDHALAVVKTMTVPFTIQVKPVTIEIAGESSLVELRAMNIKLITRQVPLTTYLLNIWTIHELLGYFGLEGHVRFYDPAAESPVFSGNELAIRMNLHAGIIINREILINGAQHVRDFIGTLMTDLEKYNCTYQQLFCRESWCMRLGSFYSTNPNQQIRRGQRVMMSFERILDKRTRELLVSVPDDWKDSMGKLSMWLMLNIDQWLQIDSLHMSSKRVRREELLLYGLFEQMKKNTRRILDNTSIQYRTIISILDNFDPDIILKFMGAVDTMKYNDTVNHSSWPFRTVTKKGVFSMGGKSGSKISPIHMRFHPSAMGITSPTATSSSNQEPGITGTLIPTVHIDINGRFIINNEYDKLGEHE
jgi:hypothetical protein